MFPKPLKSYFRASYMNVLIVGSGFVGFETGKLLERFHSVIYYDISEKRVEELKQQGKNATLDLSEAIGNSEVGFICVPTPLKGKKIDLSYVESAVRALTGKIGDKEYAVVIKSTVVPGTANKMRALLPEKVKLYSNPEFITQIASSWSQDPKMNKDDSNYFVIGCENEDAGVLEELYLPYGVPIYKMSCEEAEFIKYMNNYVLPARISVYNEMFLAAEHLRTQGVNIDTHKLAKVLSIDPRIGVYGSVHGKAYGGTCFPKDTKAFLTYLEEQGYNAKVLKAVVKVNDEMKKKYGVRE